MHELDAGTSNTVTRTADGVLKLLEHEVVATVAAALSATETQATDVDQALRDIIVARLKAAFPADIVNCLIAILKREWVEAAKWAIIIARRLLTGDEATTQLILEMMSRYCRDADMSATLLLEASGVPSYLDYMDNVALFSEAVALARPLNGDRSALAIACERASVASQLRV
jgi:hypothetical protein